jgi:hypothetical protein
MHHANWTFGVDNKISQLAAVRQVAAKTAAQAA